MTKNPANAGRRQGSLWKCFPATSNLDNATLPTIVQPEIDPVAWLAARSRVSIETARTFAELNRWGRQ